MEPTPTTRSRSGAVEQKLKKPLSQAMVFGSLSDGGTAMVDVQDDDLTITYVGAKNPTIEA